MIPTSPNYLVLFPLPKPWEQMKTPECLGIFIMSFDHNVSTFIMSVLDHVSNSLGEHFIM